MFKRKEPTWLSKTQIVEEYLSGEDTFKSLSKKYAIPERTIQSWVRSYRKKEGISGPTSDLKAQELLAEVERLKLKNDLLEEIINLSEKQTGLSLRKKSGPGQ